MANLKGSIPAGGRVEGIDLAENLLAVATSTLGGNIWDASLRVVDLSTKEVVASVQHPCGCAAVSWAKYGKQVVCAEDSGDVKVSHPHYVMVHCPLEHPAEAPRPKVAPVPCLMLTSLIQVGVVSWPFFRSNHGASLYNVTIFQFCAVSEARAYPPHILVCEH